MDASAWRVNDKGYNVIFRSVICPGKIIGKLSCLVRKSAVLLFLSSPVVL